MAYTLTESVNKDGGFIVSEANGWRSRENVTVASGQNLAAGAVVGRTSKGIGRASIPTVVGTGNGTMSLVTIGPDAEKGNYVVKLKTVVTHGGVFSVTSPTGQALPDFTLTPGAGGTTAYTAAPDHVTFSITDGSTDFALNDTFTIVVGATAPTVIGGTGTGTISALSLGREAMTGNYRVVNREAITNGGRFEVIAPDGTSLGDNFLMTAGSGTATAFTTPHINFTLTDATDFIAGNYFDVAVYNEVETGGGSVTAWDRTPSAVDGSETAVGILFGAVDASSAAAAGVILTRDCEVNEGELVWKAGTTAEEKATAKAQLARRGIVVRASSPAAA